MFSLDVAAGTALVLLLTHGCAAASAEINLFCVPALRPVLNELGPQFERSTGHKLSIRFEFVPAAMRQIEAGEAFDLVILEPASIDDMIRQRKILADTRTNLAYVGLGVAVRAGEPVPTVGSVEAFKRTLLEAKSIAYQPDTGSGKYFIELLDRLGIAADVTSKLRPKPGGAAIPSVAAGETEMVVISIPGILATPGVVLAGPLPSELQFYIRFTAGVSSIAREPDGAKALLRYLTSEEAVSTIRRKGLAPGAP